MLKEYRLQTILCIWGGILFFLFGWLLVTGPSESSYRYFGQTVIIGAYLLFVCGCFMYGKGKGWPWGVGFLGFLGPAGLLLLYLLRDKSGLILKKRNARN